MSLARLKKIEQLLAKRNNEIRMFFVVDANLTVAQMESKMDIYIILEI